LEPLYFSLRSVCQIPPQLASEEPFIKQGYIFNLKVPNTEPPLVFGTAKNTPLS
jgi:hypothetical protein